MNKKGTNHVLNSILVFIAIIVVVVPIAKYFAHKNAQQIYKQEQKAKIRNKHIQPFTDNIKVQSGDKYVEMNIRISETDNSIRNEVNGKVLDLDKKVLFSDECKDAWLNYDKSDTQLTKNLLTAYYIYKYKYIFLDWCSPAKMTNYLRDFTTKFDKDYKASLNYLDSKSGTKTEKCVIQQLAKSRKTYEFAEFEELYSEAKQYTGAGSYISKTDFCNIIDTNQEVRNTFLDIFQEDIQKLKNAEITTTNNIL